MTRVGLARTTPSYEGLEPPFHPGKAYPELERLYGEGGQGSTNHVYAAVRAALFGAGLDSERFGSADWNPLGALVERGGDIVLKPNFIRHWNPNESATLDSVITHGSVLRAVADYAFIAAGPEGSVTIAEAPQQDCDWAEVSEAVGLAALVKHFEDAVGQELHLVDIRREAVTFKDGVIVSRRALPGDPRGYRVIDLGEHSTFVDSGLDASLFRGADYDPGPTTEHHSGGKHEYLLSETVLSADLVVNLPKLKTHKKTGVTLALKNLVGINGDKNYLPHHCVGGVAQGGDEFPGSAAIDRARSAGTEWARKILARGLGTGLVRWIRKAENAVRGESFIRSGNWHGNRTTWRMCLDLNKCLYYSDRGGFYPERDAPVRKVLTILDGIVAGEGEGPLAPSDVPLGAVIAGADPLAVDVAAVSLMGFSAERIPKLNGAMQDPRMRVTEVRQSADVEVVEVSEAFEATARDTGDLLPSRPFVAHAGWVGQVEAGR